jgi:O-antigen ligase
MVALAIVGMVAVAAAFGIKDYVATRAVSGGAIERSQGLFGQANYAASFFAYYLPVVVAVGSSITRWWGRVLVLVAAGSGTLACVLTFGRGGIMALGLAVVVVAVLKRSRTLMIALFIGGLVIGADPTVQARFAETTQDKGSDSVELDDSSGARLIAWRKALDLAGQRPLTGWGFLAFRHIHHPLDAEAAARFGHGRMDVHNGHLNALVSGGLLGSAALYLMYGSIVVWCLRIRRQSRDPFTVALATGMIASVLAIMVVNLTGTRLYDRQLHGYFWMLLGTLAGAVAAEGRGRVQE